MWSWNGSEEIFQIIFWSRLLCRRNSALECCWVGSIQHWTSPLYLFFVDPYSRWTHVVSFTFWKNVSSAFSALSALETILYKNLTRKQPALYRVRIFGCVNFIYNHCTSSKFQATSIPDIRNDVNDHCVYTMQTLIDQRVQQSAHVPFVGSRLTAL